MAAEVKWAGSIHPTLIPCKGSMMTEKTVETSAYEQAREAYDIAKEAYQMATEVLLTARNDVENARQTMIAAREAFILALNDDKPEEDS